MQSLEKVLKTGQADEIEVKFVTNDGNEYFFSIATFPNLALMAPLSVSSQSDEISRPINSCKKISMHAKRCFAPWQKTLRILSCVMIMSATGFMRIPAYAEQTGIPLDLAINAIPQSQWGVYIKMTSMSAQEYQARIRAVIESGNDDHLRSNGIVWVWRTCDSWFKLVAERDDTGKSLEYWQSGTTSPNEV